MSGGQETRIHVVVSGYSADCSQWHYSEQKKSATV